MRCSSLALVGLALVSVTVTAPRLLSADEETLEQRRARLEAMSDAEKSRLLQKKRKFDELTEAEKDKYRQLHEDLIHDPNYEHLYGTMQRYAEWLKTLSSIERAELLRLPTSERLKRVKMLMEAQAQERFRQMLSDMQASKDLLSHEDQKVICKWTDQFLENHRDEILANVPENPFVEEIRSDFDPHKHLHFLRIIYFRSEPFRNPGPGRPGGETKLPPDGDNGQEAKVEVPKVPLPRPSAEEVQQLTMAVSQQARKALANATDEEERLQVIRNWMRAAAFSRFQPPVRPEELDRFVREGGVTVEEREWLESLPRDRVFPELKRIYYRKRFQSGRGGGRWGGFGGWDGKQRDGGGRGARGGPGGRAGPGRDRGFRPDEARESPGERGSRRGGPGSSPGRGAPGQRSGEELGEEGR